MAIYSVHSKGDPAHDAIFVGEGFSVLAFFFTVLWALWHRMWLAAIILAALLLGVSTFGEWSGLDELSLRIINLAISLVFGLEAQKLRRTALARRGYEEIGLAAGDNVEEAELRFFEDYVKERPAFPTEIVPVLRPTFTGSAEPLGLFNAPG